MKKYLGVAGPASAVGLQFTPLIAEKECKSRAVVTSQSAGLTEHNTHLRVGEGCSVRATGGGSDFSHCPRRVGKERQWDCAGCDRNTSSISPFRLRTVALPPPCPTHGRQRRGPAVPMALGKDGWPRRRCQP
ncbi:hypothetical protein AAFF_G00074120 [Aldrovandia affinis]|uniref:Uncharacterized protein n=1 Tax=Aldrovandia affinis TaxID=143900 RepID=A0AAD7WE20_9TELE|nr:hypothetical protein AAFF_G00074120 [Aldrovandia affinis]